LSASNIFFISLQVPNPVTKLGVVFNSHQPELTTIQYGPLISSGRIQSLPYKIIPYQWILQGCTAMRQQKNFKVSIIALLQATNSRLQVFHIVSVVLQTAPMNAAVQRLALK
jgi:hypothetical protein